MKAIFIIIYGLLLYLLVRAVWPYPNPNTEKIRLFSDYKINDITISQGKGSKISQIDNFSLGRSWTEIELVAGNSNYYIVFKTNEINPLELFKSNRLIIDMEINQKVIIYMSLINKMGRSPDLKSQLIDQVNTRIVKEFYFDESNSSWINQQRSRFGGFYINIVPQEEIQENLIIKVYDVYVD